jgi:hypothetical protein
MSKWNENTNTSSFTLMTNYFKPHLQTQVLKKRYDLPLPKFPISFQQAVPLSVVFKSCLWETTMSPLLPNKRPLIDWQWPGWVSLPPLPYTPIIIQFNVNWKSLLRARIWPLALTIGNHCYHNVGVTMQLSKATSLTALRIHPSRLYCHWLPYNYVIDKEMFFLCKQQKKSIF